jgi:hypothetical protein
LDELKTFIKSIQEEGGDDVPKDINSALDMTLK